MPGSPYGDLGGMDLGGAVQNISGIPADFTSAAQAMGFMPNPYASPAQQMEDATRFLSLMKTINDNTLGSTNASWNKLSPTNPTAAMPLYMRNMYNAYGALVNSPAGFNLLPQGSAEMFQNGGYQRGGLGTNMSRMLQAYLGQLNPSQQPGQSDVIRAQQGTPQGPGTVGANNAGTGGGPGGGAPTPSAQSGINEGTNRGGVPVLSGINDAARNLPIVGAGISGAENAIGDLTGQSNTQGGPATGGGIPVLSGINDMSRAIFPGLGGAEDIVGGLVNAATGSGEAPSTNQGAPGAGSNVSVNTQGSPAPRSLGLLLQKMGLNSVPQGVDPNSFVDNALYQILGGR